MQPLKISVITVCYNAEKTIERALTSVLSQDYDHLEYIVIDGGSRDLTMDIINRYRHRISRVVSESDAGIYDAMNKGIALASGEIIGTLNADDRYADETVLRRLAAVFQQSKADVVYGDLIYTRLNGTVQRRWRSGQYHTGDFNLGWMPPHPTFYCRRSLFSRFGNYRPEYGTAADYELMLRFIHSGSATVAYLPQVLIDMQAGGVSNNSYTGRFRVFWYDLKAMRQHAIRFPLMTVILKRLTKLKQFVHI